MLELLRAIALRGRGNYQEAAAAAAALIGFDMTTKSFAAEDPPSAAASPEGDRVARESAALLASLFAERFKRPDDAMMILEHAAKTHPDDSTTWLLLARWRQARGDFTAAEAAVRRAAELAPDEPDVLFTSLELAVAQRRLDLAEQIAAKAKRLFPQDELSFRAQASVALQRGSADQAVAVLREGLAALPERPALMLMLADVLIQSERLDEAEGILASFVTRYGSTNAAAGMLEARLLMAQKRWLPAKQKLDSIRPMVAISEDLTKQVDLLLGQCHEILGQFDEQLAANKRVLRDDNDSLEIGRAHV